MDNSSSIGSAWIPIAIAVIAFITFIGFIILGIVRVVQERRKQRELASRPPGLFVFAKIMEPVGPLYRGDKYGEPLDQGLQAHGLGRVTGGGTQMDKSGAIEWVGIDIELADLDRGIEFTQIRLRELGAPRGSLLEYRVGEEKMTVQISFGYDRACHHQNPSTFGCGGGMLGHNQT